MLLCCFVVYEIVHYRISRYAALTTEQMMDSPNKSRKRNKQFTKEESGIILEEMQNFHHILSSKSDSCPETKAQKQQIWKNVAER